MVIAIVAGVLGCAGGKATNTPDPTTGDSTTASDAPRRQVVQLETRDGVTLEADWYAPAAAGAPAFVLLHMIPPNNDRTNWPRSFARSLVAEGWSALAIDRRGAGGSGGVAEEAYSGEKGRLDVEAAAAFLEDQGAGDLVIIGASNGTTSMIDYAVWAAGEGLQEPVALGFMTGGGYTENQTTMSSLPDVPAVFTYSTSEKAWSEEQQGLGRGAWTFLEYPGGSHGSRMFDSKPEVADDLIDFFNGVLGGAG